MDPRGLEADLRNIAGVVACSVSAQGVSILLADDADRDVVADAARRVGAAHGVDNVRILSRPRPRRPIMAAHRPRIAAGAAAVAAIALIATIVPIGRKVSPRLTNRPAFRAAPAPQPNDMLPPVFVAEPRSARSEPVTGSIKAAGRLAVAPRSPGSRRVPDPAPVGGGAPSPRPAPQLDQCDHPTAHGRQNREGPGNRSWHRHHTHKHGHSRHHWFDCE